MRKANEAAAWLGTALLLACVLLPTGAFAQGCALCYTQAAGSGARMIAALRSGIFFLMVPPVLITIGIAWMAYKKRNQFNDGQETNSEDPSRQVSL